MGSRALRWSRLYAGNSGSGPTQGKGQRQGHEALRQEAEAPAQADGEKGSRDRGSVASAQAELGADRFRGLRPRDLSSRPGAKGRSILSKSPRERSPRLPAQRYARHAKRSPAPASEGPRA